MRNGIAIGIPLSLLQIQIHKHTHATIDLPIILNNFALCNAVYDADRIEGDFWDPRRFPTRLSAMASSLYYIISPTLVYLSPLVLCLHLFYAQVKPFIAPIKPFFVAYFWTLLVYYIPLMKDHLNENDYLYPASFFLSIAALSHVADIVDKAEDEREKIVTPAVAMQKPELYAVALAVGSVYLHSLSSQPNLLYDSTVLAVTAGVVYNKIEEISVLFAVVLLFYTRANDVHILAETLRGTEGVHKFAIDTSISAIEFAMKTPEPYRTFLVNTIWEIVELGDSIGSFFLSLYKNTVLKRL